MIAVAAPTVMRIPAGELGSRARARFGGELRRAGTFAQLGMLGASACLDALPRAGSLGVLWASAHGARMAAQAALAEAAGGDPVMPFTFVATQPHLTATLLAQRGETVTRAAFVHVAPAHWPMLLELARAWLSGSEAVLLGWVEEAVGAGEHQSDWCLLRGVPDEPLPQARGALPATFGEWLKSATSA